MLAVQGPEAMVARTRVNRGYHAPSMRGSLHAIDTTTAQGMPCQHWRHTLLQLWLQHKPPAPPLPYLVVAVHPPSVLQPKARQTWPFDIVVKSVFMIMHKQATEIICRTPQADVQQQATPYESEATPTFCTHRLLKKVCGHDSY